MTNTGNLLSCCCRCVTDYPLT